MNNRLFPEEISENEKISCKLIVNVDRKYSKTICSLNIRPISSH